MSEPRRDIREQKTTWLLGTTDAMATGQDGLCSSRREGLQEEPCWPEHRAGSMPESPARLMGGWQEGGSTEDLSPAFWNVLVAARRKMHKEQGY